MVKSPSSNWLKLDLTQMTREQAMQIIGNFCDQMIIDGFLSMPLEHQKMLWGQYMCYVTNEAPDLALILNSLRNRALACDALPEADRLVLQNAPQTLADYASRANGSSLAVHLHTAILGVMKPNVDTDRGGKISGMLYQ